jgi:hypothetical protein
MSPIDPFSLAGMDESLVNENEYQNAADQAAERLGMKVQRPKDNEIFLDFDTDEAYLLFKARATQMGLNTWIERFSKSGYPHRHVILRTDKPITDWQRLAYQAVLCSDSLRAYLDVKTLHQTGQTDTCLFIPN